MVGTVEILREIKSRTQRPHGLVERALDLLSPTLSHNGYEEILRTFYGFYFPLEKVLAVVMGASNAVEDYAERLSKSRLLEKDLRFLAPDLPLAQIEKFELQRSNLSITEALGAMYVMEGATLGGRYISRHLSQRLQLSNERGGSFFEAYGVETANKWKLFQEVLTRYSAKSAATEIISGAESTFDQLLGWIAYRQKGKRRSAADGLALF